MSDYLWDKSGEPDPEVQHLEQLLGGLRSKPRPLELPAAPPRRAFSPGLAAAAAALIVLALGVWFGVRHNQRRTVQPIVAGGSNASQPERQSQGLQVEPSVEPKGGVDRPEKPLISAAPTRPKTIRHSSVRKDREPSLPAVTAEEEQAKEQLMLALRIASAKLNLAQKKVQETAN